MKFFPKNTGKAALIIITIILVILIGWSALVGKMYDYNHSKAAKQVGSVPFDVKLPTKVPFDEMTVWETNIGTSKQQLVITLMNIHKETIDIKVTKNSVEYAENVKKENVQINKEIQGVFIPNEGGKRSLLWQDGDLYYEITYHSKLTTKEVRKSQLIKMADSFK